MENVADTLADYAAQKEGGAFVLQGAWGVGKTHFWREVVKPKVLGKPWHGQYSYLSLFGINALSELKLALAVASEEWNRGSGAKGWNEAENGKKPWGYDSRVWLSRTIQPNMAELASIIPQVGDSISRAITFAGFYRIRDRLICFDDIERKGSGLSMRDFLGMVSFLTEERNCRIIVLLNLNTLSEEDKSEWDRSSEKVFHGVVHYLPTPENSCKIALAPYLTRPWCDALHRSFSLLQVTNIRLIRRACTVMDLVEDLAPSESHQDLWTRPASSVAIFVFSLFGRGNGGPPIDRVMRRPSITTGSSRSDEEIHWDSLISNLDLYIIKAMDTSLLEVVETGVIRGQDLRNSILQHDINLKANARSNAFSSTWTTLVSTFADNQDEVLKSITETWPSISSDSTVGNLSNTVKLVRSLGEPKLASDYIDAWINQRLGERRSELSERSIGTFSDNFDDEILSKIEKAREHVVTTRPVSLEQALRSLIIDEANDDEKFDAVARSTPESVRDVLVQLNDPMLGNKVISLLSKRRGIKEANAKGRAILVDALNLIARSSPFSEYRIKEILGIDLPPPSRDLSADNPAALPSSEMEETVDE